MITIENARGWFPPDLEELLDFEEAVIPVKGPHIIIRPKKLLGREKFEKVISIVKEHAGEYVSVGKFSHFRIPKLQPQ